MKALLLKDVYLARTFAGISTLFVIFFYALIVGLRAAANTDDLIIGQLISQASLLFSMSFLHLTVGANSIFARMIPCSKRARVCELYIVLSFIALCFLMIQSLSYGIFSTLKDSFNAEVCLHALFENASLFFTMFAIYGFITAVERKSNQKTGLNFVLLSCAVTIIATWLIEIVIPLKTYAIIAVCALFLYIISWILSIKFYRDKEIC